MDWWYKSEKHPVTAENKFSLQETIKDVLREGKSLAKINLYHDENFFYVKTTNRISLNYFLAQNSFEEMEEDPASSLTVLFGPE
ncbi:hypothetical protein CNR22_08380 [Sphingobacteriaceae bacterium]|nr:hypothetical protein CNR22_08380 [Sphingobacteriaceae bacterium]